MRLVQLLTVVVVQNVASLVDSVASTADSVAALVDIGAACVLLDLRLAITVVVEVAANEVRIEVVLLN